MQRNLAKEHNGMKSNPIYLEIFLMKVTLNRDNLSFQTGGAFSVWFLACLSSWREFTHAPCHTKTGFNILGYVPKVQRLQPKGKATSGSQGKIAQTPMEQIGIYIIRRGNLNKPLCIDRSHLIFSDPLVETQHLFFLAL